MGNCSRDFNNNILHCPCTSGCPNGCPCDDYVCPTTTPSITTTTALTTTSTSATTTSTTTALAKTNVLILNTYKSSNVPRVINADGLDDPYINFDYGDNTEVKYSCGLTFRNKYFVFGGNLFTTQISQIIDCRLQKIGELSFSHKFGGCANVNDNRIYLCFNDRSSDYKKCRMASSPTDQFEQISDSIFDHQYIRIAAGNSKLLQNVNII